MWIIPILVLVIATLIFLVVALLAGQIIGPLYDVVVADAAVKRMGYDVGVEAATRIGLKYVLPLLALSLVVWFLVMRLATDTYMGNRR